MFTILNGPLSWAVTGFGNIFLTEEEAKGLDNRYCVKFMQFGIGLFPHINTYNLRSYYGNQIITM